MRRTNPKGRILPIATLLASLLAKDCYAQVYSLGLYSAGTSYFELWSLEMPMPPYHYKATTRSRYETADGLVMMGFGHEQEPGVVLCRYLDVEWGSASFTVWLDREPPKRARELEAECAARERRLKGFLDSGHFREKLYVLSNRTDSEPDQDALFALREREKFSDEGSIQAMGPESNYFRITASTNDLVIWDRVMKEFDKPRPK